MTEKLPTASNGPAGTISGPGGGSGANGPMTKDREADLLPCPFCGSVANIADNTGPKLCTNAHAYAFCTRIGCPGRGHEQDTVAEAIAAWNTRTPPTASDRGQSSDGRGFYVHHSDDAPPQTTAPPIPTASEADGWQDISTAPKDGQVILVWSEDLGQQIVNYDKNRSPWGWATFSGVHFREEVFINWQSLPDPPVVGE